MILGPIRWLLSLPRITQSNLKTTGDRVDLSRSIALEPPISGAELAVGGPPQRGYRAELEGLEPDQPHTLHDLPTFLEDNLGRATLSKVQDSQEPFLIAVGEGHDVLKRLKSEGWSLGEAYPKAVGFHQISPALTPDGRAVNVVWRVNGDDRITHLEGLLKLAGLPAHRLEWRGENRSYEQDYLETFQKLGRPKLVVYGLAKTAAASVLSANPIANARHLYSLFRNRGAPKERDDPSKSDMDGLSLYRLHLQNGEQVWFLPPLYGDLSRDVVKALKAHQVPNILFLGTAGALSGEYQVGDIVSPSHSLGPDRKRRSLDWTKKLEGAKQGGTHLRVSTPCVETRQWAEDCLESGVDLVEVELSYWLEELRDHPQIQFSAVTMISDVLTGPQAQDMTAWSFSDTNQARRTLRPLMASALGDDNLKVRGLDRQPLVETNPLPALRPPLKMSPPSGTTLNPVETNYACAGVSGSFLVTSEKGHLSVDEAASLARQVAPHLPLQDESLTEIVLLEDFNQLDSLTESPSGQLDRYFAEGTVVDRDGLFTRIFLNEPHCPPLKLDEKSPLRLAKVQRRDDPLIQLGKPLPQEPSLFCGGLVSISAEPPEGFFAASTAVELEQAGYQLRPADQADIWLYRVPDVRPQSYFDFTFSSPDRPFDAPREKPFKIATGIGPAYDPGSSGGREADLLWLGDEQHGVLSEYLATLRAPGARLSDLFEHQGFVQKLSDRQVAIGHLDKNHALSNAGFESLDTSPSVYRRVYSQELDTYLGSLFDYRQNRPAVDKSFLLATSRGCTQGCALCCSGGLKAFQSFSAERMMEELEKIAQEVPGEQRAEVFFLDSNFNNNPARLVKFAKLFEDSPLNHKFDFYVRHNSVKGFLRHREGQLVPHRQLIQAYKTLGIEEVWMGVDTYDDASTLTLKSHRHQLARKGTDARPTYTFAELADLIAAFEQEGLETKGFYLGNNPWVSDLDRLDSYYNILSLWLENPHFSLDTREQTINNLLPFAGSPIADVAKQSPRSLVKEGQFQAEGPVGCLDERIDLSGLGCSRARSGADDALARFSRSLRPVRDLLSQRLEEPEVRLMAAKMVQREDQLQALLARVDCPGAELLKDDIEAWRDLCGELPEVDQATQNGLFSEKVEDLIDGLRELHPIRAKHHQESERSAMRRNGVRRVRSR